MSKFTKVLKIALIGTAIVVIPIMFFSFVGAKELRRKMAKDSILDIFKEFSNKVVDSIKLEKVSTELKKLNDREMVAFANYVKYKQFGTTGILNADTNKIQMRFDKFMMSIKQKTDLLYTFKEYGIKGF